MLRRTILRNILVVFFTCLPLLAFSQELSINQIKKQNSNLVGKIHYTQWFFPIYDAELYSANGKFDWNNPFLLKIHYLRSFKSKSIVNLIIKEMSKQHPDLVKKNKKRYSEIFSKIIPNAKKDSSLYGYMSENGYCYIYSDSKLLGKISDKQLSKYFLGIWLSDKSSDVEMSKQLRGL